MRTLALSLWFAVGVASGLTILAFTLAILGWAPRWAELGMRGLACVLAGTLIVFALDFASRFSYASRCRRR